MSRRRNLTDPDIENQMLSPQQETAIVLLVSGKTVTDCAAAVGVARPTVSEWLHHNPLFQSSLNSRRQELFEATGNRLWGLLPRALDTLEAALAGEQALAAAVHILKACGVYKGISPPQGPTDLEGAALEIACADYARRVGGEELAIEQKRLDFDRVLKDLAAGG
jgi:hypothetical protein